MGMADGGGVFFFLCLPLRPKELDLRRPLVISELGVVGLEGEQINCQQNAMQANDGLQHNSVTLSSFLD